MISDPMYKMPIAITKQYTNILFLHMYPCSTPPQMILSTVTKRPQTQKHHKFFQAMLVDLSIWQIPHNFDVGQRFLSWSPNAKKFS